MEGLVGHIPELAQQKFSSNVVEKCLKLPGLSANQVAILEPCPKRVFRVERVMN
jgi:hypothetical protein